MSRTADWPWWHAYRGPDDYRIRELLRAVLDLHGYYGDPDVWLWRGQASSKHKLSPAVHTRVLKSGQTLNDSTVVATTRDLLDRTRAAGLNVHEGVALPDLALLAQLQHHGAATPLLDVSLDPLVALYMAVVSTNLSDDEQDGVLFAIRQPSPLPPELAIRPFDTRLFEDVYADLPTDKPFLYVAPDVSDRLRIQRGAFLLSRHSGAHPKVTINSTLDDVGVTDTWIARRMAARGQQGVIRATSDIAAFKVTAKFKPKLRKWLEGRTGLTPDFVYPTAWHRPHLESFATSHGRLARL